MMRKAIAVASLLLLIVGCATPPSPAEITAADYGEFPSDYKDKIQSHMSTVLFDPESARYDFTKGPTKMWTSAFGGKRRFGYGACAYINAKNRFGGYVGRQLYFFLINNGQIIQKEGGSSELSKASAEKLCGSF